MFICMTIAGLGTETGVRGRLVMERVLPGELALRWLETEKCLCSEPEGYAHKLREASQGKKAAA